MIWPSRAVPSVVTTIAWVSPRVNSAETWGRGSTPTLEAIGRTVSSARPSMRTLIDRPIRQLFPAGVRNEHKIIDTVLSMQPEVNGAVRDLIGASAALSGSEKRRVGRNAVSTFGSRWQP